MISDKNNIFAGPSGCLQYAILHQKPFHGYCMRTLSFITLKMCILQYLNIDFNQR